MNGFYGYGSWKHPLWFIGMEEGGCDSLNEFNRRVEVWIQQGRKELEDARSYHEAIGVDTWFRNGARLQQTWGKLIRVYLSLHQQPTDRESVRRFQMECFGNQERGFTLLELFPLPSVDAKRWFYSSITELPELASRDKYTSVMYPKRADEFRRRIRLHQPKQVVCYGLTYRSKWEGLVEQTLEQSALEDVLETKVSNTLVLVMPHPVSHGRTQAYWSEVGKYLKCRS